MATGNGGPAYPVRLENWSTEEKDGFDNDVVKPNSFLHYPGMTLRDYFATKAMAAIVSTVPHLATVAPGDVAEEAYQFADAMLAERAK